MEDMVEQVKFIESVVDQNRECHPTPEDIDQFEALVIEAEWAIHDQFRKFVEMFYGTPSIEVKGMSKLDLLWNGLYLDHDVSIVWGEIYDEYIIPVGSFDLSRMYVSETGKIYGDIRDVGMTEFYGYSIEEGMYNLLTGKVLSAIPFEFDESRFYDWASLL